MKSLFLLCFGVLLGLNSQLSAQNNPKNVFDTPFEMSSAKPFIWGGDGPSQLVIDPGNKLKKTSQTEANRYGLPPNSVITQGAFTKFTPQGCIQISKPSNCSSCRLVWLDRNGDGLIQVKKELRCVGPNKKARPIIIQKVDCP